MIQRKKILPGRRREYDERRELDKIKMKAGTGGGRGKYEIIDVQPIDMCKTETMLTNVCGPDNLGG